MVKKTFSAVRIVKGQTPPSLLAAHHLFPLFGGNIGFKSCLPAYLHRVSADNGRFHRPINQHPAHRQHKSPKMHPTVPHGGCRGGKQRNRYPPIFMANLVSRIQMARKINRTMAIMVVFQFKCAGCLQIKQPEKQPARANVFQAVWVEYRGRRAARCTLANAKRVAALGILVFWVSVFDIFCLQFWG